VVVLDGRSVVAVVVGACVGWVVEAAAVVVVEACAVTTSIISVSSSSETISTPETTMSERSGSVELVTERLRGGFQVTGRPGSDPKAR
jgi:hypothetical protein